MFKKKKKKKRLWLGKDLKIEWSPHFKSSFLYHRIGSYRCCSCHRRESCCSTGTNAGWVWLICRTFDLVITFFAEIIFWSLCYFVFWKVFVIVHPLSFFFFFFSVTFPRLATIIYTKCQSWGVLALIVC